MQSLRLFASTALACALTTGHVPLANASTSDTMSVYELGATKITTDDEPVLVQTGFTTFDSHQPTFELAESLNSQGAHQIVVKVSDPVAVQFGDWQVPSAYTHTLTFTAGQGQQLGLGTYVAAYEHNGQDPDLRLSHDFPAFCPCFDSGPWLNAATFTIDHLERDAGGKIQSFSASFSSEHVEYWRDPGPYSLAGHIQYNMPISAVPEPDTIALLLAGLTFASVRARREVLRKPR